MLRVLPKFSIPNVLLSIEFPVSNLQYKLHKMTMLRKSLIAKVWEIPKKTSMVGFMLVKLQAYSVITTNLL